MKGGHCRCRIAESFLGSQETVITASSAASSSCRRHWLEEMVLEQLCFNMPNIKPLFIRPQRAGVQAGFVVHVLICVVWSLSSIEANVKLHWLAIMTLMFFLLLYEVCKGRCSWRFFETVTCSQRHAAPQRPHVKQALPLPVTLC